MAASNPQSVSPEELAMLPVAQIKACMEADAKRDEPLIEVIGKCLEWTVQAADKAGPKSNALPAFAGRAPIAVSALVDRIRRYSEASPCCFGIAVIYLERLKKRVPDLRINSNNFQRMILISTMLAAKHFDDVYFSNKVWAKIGGITTQELNKLELQMLDLLGWRLYLHRDEYEWYMEELRAQIPGRVETVAVSAPTGPAQASAPHSQHSHSSDPMEVDSGTLPAEVSIRTPNGSLPPPVADASMLQSIHMPGTMQMAPSGGLLAAHSQIRPGTGSTLSGAMDGLHLAPQSTDSLLSARSTPSSSLSNLKVTHEKGSTARHRHHPSAPYPVAC